MKTATTVIVLAMVTMFASVPTATATNTVTTSEEMCHDDPWTCVVHFWDDIHPTIGKLICKNGVDEGPWCVWQPVPGVDFCVYYYDDSIYDEPIGMGACHFRLIQS